MFGDTAPSGGNRVTRARRCQETQETQEVSGEQETGGTTHHLTRPQDSIVPRQGRGAKQENLKFKTLRLSLEPRK